MNSLSNVVVTCIVFLSAAAPVRSETVDNCIVGGQWITPADARIRPAAPTEILSQARDARFVLLGESHDNADHHLWQLQTLAMLLGARDELVIGMEMFPRRVQPVLDRWIAGQLTELALLEQSEWARVWRFDPELYLPILRFARLNRIPIVALNVERSLISEIGMRGLAAVPAERREGVTEPAPATAAYRDMLRSSFRQHGKVEDSRFEYFVEAQQFWDRAFAQALADAALAHPAALVVGIVGSGHLRHGYGVPHQLRASGMRRTKVWLPVDAVTPCDELVDIADAVFAVRSNRNAARPTLGVYLGDDAGGAGVREVVAGSVAERAGVISGDRVLAAAGVNIESSGDLIAIVRRQSPGTWLPITVERDGKRIELVAKFPARMPSPVAPERRADDNGNE